MDIFLLNILKSLLQTNDIENQTVPLNSVETEFSQMPDLLCDYRYSSLYILLVLLMKSTKKDYVVPTTVVGRLTSRSI